MIYVSSALKQQEIIDLLEAITGDISYKYLEKKGIKLAFEVVGGELEKAVDVAKATIKGSEIGKALYFQVSL